MDPDLAATIQALRETLEEMEARLSRLEGRAPPQEGLAAPPPVAVPLAPGRTMALIGRSLMVLGGAYFLRAATDLGVLPEWLGALLALAYAGALMVLADRAATPGSAGFHAAVAIAIAASLTDEAVVRLGLIPPATGAAMAAGFSGALSLVAWRRRQALLAWLAIGAATLLAVALAVQTRQILPCLWLATATVAVAGLLGRALRQAALPSLPLTAGGLLAIWLVERSSQGDGPLLALLGFFAAAVGAVRWSRAPSQVQVVEAGLLLPAVVVESARLAAGRAWFGAALLLLAASGFAAARSQRFFRGYWLIVALIALGVLAGGGVLALFYLGVTAALIAVGADVLELTVALVAAAAAAGLWEFTLRALTFPSVAPPSGMALVVLAASAVAAVLRPRAPLLLLVTLGVAGLAAWGGITWASPSPAVAASIRTSVLAAMAVMLALASRHPRARAAGALVHPLLAAAGLELLLDGVRVGTSATVFVDLAVCGLAVMLASRLRVATQAAPSLRE